MLAILAEIPALGYTAAVLLGLLVGSFLNVVILRFPKQLFYDWRRQCHELLELEDDAESKPPGLIHPRSQCPKCQHQITALENIPVLSWLFLKGRCSACGTAISKRYPLVELLTGIVSVVVVWQLGFTAAAGWALLFSWTLIALAGIDIDHKLLPDNITLPLMWLGLILSLSPVFADIRASLIGAAAGYLSLWSVYHLFRLITGKEGMGHGDFKLLAAIGAWVGWQGLPLVILLSSLLGAVIGIILMAGNRDARGKPIPFGPYLAIAGWITLLWGEQIIDAYLGFSGL